MDLEFIEYNSYADHYSRYFNYLEGKNLIKNGTIIKEQGF